MKHSLFVKSLVALTATLPALASETDTNNWVGSISASQQVVQVGDVPTVTWDVKYPAALLDLVSLDENTATSKKTIEMEVRVIGAAWGKTRSFHYVEGQIQAGAGWLQIFWGDHHMIDSSKVVYQATLPVDTVIDFRGCGAKDKSGPFASSWSPWYSTTDVTPHVVLLKDGDTAPHYDPAYEIQDGVQDYLSPYIDGNTGLITLGPRDVIYLFEFAEGSFGTKYFDLQDLVVVVTFSESDQQPNP
ncbi:hypothetical protein [Sulfuriroseicoccus oceanibius]|uniref:DUF4114 domain-containing protein n=1 Tax=Sulfuriroseicoccus oceanibius TaxID=2707525 RepID=A0A6B3L5M0_9BACT|nr:hypothetical protein [Sulfuriroseicoccus oceanibius]QQL45191.1 hypothetical protein G3M56_000970 [Sulfuriroseicoccus oceanibius]